MDLSIETLHDSGNYLHAEAEFRTRVVLDRLND